MAHIDSIPFPPGKDGAGSRQGTVAIIVRAARLGLYTPAEARLLINQITTDPGEDRRADAVHPH